jgi:serine/threonine protein kinase HipA of HipAB toxin-antitoxin module
MMAAAENPITPLLAFEFSTRRSAVASAADGSGIQHSEYNADEMTTATRVKPFEMIDDEMAAVLRRKTGIERLTIAFRMIDSARTMIGAQLRHAHPDWTAEEVATETARRIAHGNL